MIQKHDLHRLIFQVDNPVFPHPGPLVQSQFHKPIMPLRGGGEDFHHHVLGTPAAAIIQFRGVADHRKVGLHYRVHVLRLVSFSNSRTAKGAG